MPSALSSAGDRLTGVRLEDVILSVGCALAVVAVVVAQLAWIIAFDSVGLDRVLPDLVMTTLLPALTVTVPPAAYAQYRYGRSMAAVVAALVFVAALTLASWTIGFYGLCGGC